MTTLKSDCRKFAPNIFNKTKCQNCFRTKDSHSAEALESNRATRKVAKCGYLFVAPDWDFTLSANRTKRWQRRWFILYDDGELTYSVDEHPNTVPQAVIDMNKVVDVSDAEDVTGNQFSVAITAPEKIHFVKGTSRDESKWWFDVLSRFPKSMVRGKHKRNATFPGGITTTSPVAVDQVSKTSNGYPSSPIVRPRFHSFNTDNNNRTGIELEWQLLGRPEEDVFPTKDTPPKNNMARNSTNQTEEIENINNLIKSNIISKVTINHQDQNYLLDNKQEHQKNILDNVKDNISPKDRLKIEDGLELSKSRSRRYLKRENRGIRSQRSRSDGVAKMIPPVKDIDAEWLGQNSRMKNYHHNPVYLLLSDVPTLKRFESLESLQTNDGSPLPRRRHTSEKVESCVKSYEKNNYKDETELITNKTETSPADSNRNTSTPRNGFHGQQILQKRLSPINVVKSPRENNGVDFQVKGESDSPIEVEPIFPLSSADIRLDLNSQDLFIKKGWLLRLGTQKEWCKHWFVLKNTTLSYYRDPSAEDSGILDGILDLGLVKDVIEVETDRNFAFSITTWDDKKHIIGSVTIGIRCSWMLAICRAISLLDNNNKQSPVIETQRHNSVSSPPLSSEEMDRPADVSSSDDHSEYYSIIDDEELIERCNSPRALPPSPPVNRTAISRVKERARSRSNSRSRVSRRKLHSPVASDGEYSTMNGENGHESDCGANDNFLRESSGRDYSVVENGVVCEDVPDGKGVSKEVVALEEKCGELEERVKEQEKQIGEKSAELNNLKSLKGSYRDLVEKYNNLKKKVEEKQRSLAEDQNEDHYKLKYESLKTKYRREKADRENRNKEGLTDSSETTVDELIVALSKTKELLCKLKERIENFNGKKDISASALKDVVKLCIEVENLLTTGERKSKKDVELSKLKNSVSELQGSCNSKQEELDRRLKELGAIQESLDRKKSECRQLQLELQKLKDENHAQMAKLKERHSASSPNSATDLESLVANERHRFERALEEIRKLKRELKESQDSYDDIEICYFKMIQEMQDSTELHSSQMSLMTARVDDLTSKLTTSERALRQLKLKTAKLEARQERRRSSLKGKEALSLSKEYEGKLVELEQKINVIESTLHPASDETHKDDFESSAQPPQQVKRKASQDSTTSESNSMLLRLHSLDTKVKSVTSTVDSVTSNSTNPLEKPKICLQVKSATEDGVCAEDAMENWSSLSVTTSMSDLHTIEPDDQEMPTSLSEYVETLGQKIETMLKWLRSLLLLLAKPESTENFSTDSQLSSLGALLDQLLTCRPEDSVCSGIETLVLKTMYDIVLLQESAKSAFKLNDFSSYKAKSVQVGIVQLESIMQELEVKVSNANETNWLQVEDLLKVITKSEDVFQGSFLGRASLCLSKEQLLTKLNELEQKFESMSESILKFQNARLQSIQPLNLVSSSDYAELPVKDSDQEAFATKIQSTIADVEDRVLSMLASREEQQLSLLDYDHNIEINWGCAVRHYLRTGIASLESKVKESLLRFYWAISKDKTEETYLISTVHDLAQASAVEATLRGSIETLGQRLRETEIDNQPSSAFGKCLQQRLHRQASFLATTVLKCPSCVCEECSKQQVATPSCLGMCMMEMVEHYKRVLAEDRVQFKRDLDQLQKAVDSLHEEQERQRQDGCKTCRHLQQQVQRLHGELESCTVLAKSGSLCERCKELHRKLEITSEKHQKELAVAIEREQADAKHKIQEMLQQKEQVHADDIAKLKQEIHVAQRHFKHLQDQFDGQIKSLQNTYEQKLAQKKDYFREEAVLQRYTADMGDLKGLCEKGLVAIENSHKRVMAKVERKHKQQLDSLQEEKEKALAQETQATLTALEAIRKAHKQELQQEISKLKEELLQKMQTDQESELILKHHESELSEIKHAILSLSEKYSVKCLENAALEEKLHALSQQLHESSYQVFDLLARNKQLGVYLSADVVQKREFVKSSEKHLTVEHLKQLLDLKEYELVEEKEENAQLRNRLHQAQNHIEMLDIHCQQLDQSLQTQKRGLWDSEISGLRNKLEAIVAASSMGIEESDSNTASSMGDKQAEHKFRSSMCVASVRSSELLRSSGSHLQKAVPLS